MNAKKFFDEKELKNIPLFLEILYEFNEEELKNKEGLNQNIRNSISKIHNSSNYKHFYKQHKCSSLLNFDFLENGS